MDKSGSVPVLTPYLDDDDPTLLTLRDGTRAEVRIAGRQDQEALTEFFHDLSAQSRWRRFFSMSFPRADVIASMCDGTNPRSGLSLVVICGQGADTARSPARQRIIACGSYRANNETTAEVALAVADTFHGKGLGTLLLERLALLAVRHGFTHFYAVTQADNQAMRDVFRESGFVVQEKPDGGEVEVDLAIVPSETTMARMETRHRVATVASLRPFFRPQSIAVVGASRQQASIGYRLVDTIIRGGYSGTVYPVNPKLSTGGLTPPARHYGLAAFPSVRDLPEPVDLAVIAVPRDAVLGVVDECAARGVRALVIITAGFAEVGTDGAQLQRQLVEKVRGYGLRLIGPNCLGLLSTDPEVRLNATFVPTFPSAGHVAMSSDSGGLGLAFLAAADRLGLGMSSFVSVGNRADVSSNDLLEYWEEDASTHLILLYLESFGNPRRFARIARRVGRRKPIVAVKAGRTQAGRRAAGSHTAALATRDVAVDALFHQTGVIRAESLEELFNLAALLESQPLPGGRRVGILSNAGGPAILCADACEAAGLLVPELSLQTRAELATFLPAAASLGNPVDMIASATPEDLERALRSLLKSSEVDALIVIYVFTGAWGMDDVTRAIQQGVASTPGGTAASKPVLTCLMPDQAGLSHIGSGKPKLPCYAFPETAARALGKAAAYAEWRSQPLGKIPFFEGIDVASARLISRNALHRKDEGWLSTEETRVLLQAMDLPVAPGGLAATAEQAVAVAERVGFPVAVKLASKRLVHKTELGCVHLHLNDPEKVRQAFQQIQDRLTKDNMLDTMEGVLIQPMVSGGTEVFVGLTQDPVFGPLIAFGLGGIHVEILGDVCFRVTPLTDRDAREMVQGIRGHRLFAGYRGHAPADVPAIEDLLLRVSRLVEEIPEIVELDLNPVFALPPGQGCRIVDARIRAGGGKSLA